MLADCPPPGKAHNFQFKTSHSRPLNQERRHQTGGLIAELRELQRAEVARFSPREASPLWEAPRAVVALSGGELRQELSPNLPL